MLSIERLQLRIPGLSAEEARRLGDEIAQRVADRWPAQVAPLHLGALELRLTLPAGTDRARLADLIAAAIVEGLV